MSRLLSSIKATALTPEQNVAVRLLNEAIENGHVICLLHTENKLAPGETVKVLCLAVANKTTGRVEFMPFARLFEEPPMAICAIPTTNFNDMKLRVEHKNVALSVLGSWTVAE